jgi:hypothetical protein
MELSGAVLATLLLLFSYQRASVGVVWQKHGTPGQGERGDERSRAQTPAIRQ